MACSIQAPAVIEPAPVPCIYVTGLYAETTIESAQIVGWVQLPALGGAETRRIVLRFATERSVLLEFTQQLVRNFRKP